MSTRWVRTCWRCSCVSRSRHFSARRSVSATLHRQDLRPSRVAQIGHQRHVEPVPLLQAQFIQPNVGEHTLGIDLSILGQLILDDPVYRLGRDSQATGNLLRRAANQRAEHELLEAISVGHVLAFERGDNGVRSQKGVILIQP